MATSDARGGQRHLLRPALRVSVASGAHRPGPLEHRLSLVRRLARRMRVRAHKPRPGDDGSPARGARRQPFGRRPRQPKCQDHRGGRPTGVRCGQEDQRSQASRPGRHGRARPSGRAAPGRRAGPRRRRGPAGRLAADLPFLECVFADGAYDSERVADACSATLEIVRKIKDQVGFVVLPRRWVVERFFAWIGRNRRLAKDFEASLASAAAFLYAASVMLLIRRLARPA